VPHYIEGFSGHAWADYPAHPHMLTAGSLIGICEACGLDPLLFWTYGVDNDQWMRRHFGDTWESPRVQAVWRMIFCMNGLGKELNFVLTPAGRPDIAPQVAAVRAELEWRRAKEVEFRSLLAGMP
jgi:hypothetical protein